MTPRHHIPSRDILITRTSDESECKSHRYYPGHTRDQALAYALRMWGARHDVVWD